MKTTQIQLDPPYLDDEEREIMEAYNRGEFEPVEDFEKSKRELEEAARNTLKIQKARKTS